MNKKLFLSVALLVSAYYQTGFAFGHMHAVLARIQDEKTKKESREQSCKKILGAMAYYMKHGVTAKERDINLSELSQNYANLKCYEFEEQTNN